MTFRPTLDRYVGTVGTTLAECLAECQRRLLWVMLNPSTAYDHIDDPTIRRCIRFTRDLGYGLLRVVNLFDARATKPADLYRLPTLETPGNAELIRHEMRNATTVVFAWGAHADRPPASVNALRTRTAALELGITAMCLGRTTTGHPLHPLYLPADRELIPYEVGTITAADPW